jgi:3-dehydroquinate synthetase
MTGSSIYQPGMIVKHPTQPDWGLGQVQSTVGGKVTVNFRDAGKVVIDEMRVNLLVVSFE